MENSSGIRAAFIDRDGVINRELNYVHRIEDFHLIPGALEGLRRLSDAGFCIIVITNQAGIAKGLYTEHDFRILNDYMISIMHRHRIEICDVYYCPHHPEGTVKSYTTYCACRKPSPGMIITAAEEHGLNLKSSVLIGDKASDCQAGRSAGVGLNIIVQSGHSIQPADSLFFDYCCTDLNEASRLITSKQHQIII